MSNKIRLRRGVAADLPTLDTGEPGLVTDTGQLYIGNGGSNVLIGGTGSTHAAVTLGVGSDPALALTGQELTLTLSGTSHDAVTLGADADVLLGLSTQQITLDTQTANYVFAGPTTGSPAVPTFRALVSGDIPALDHGAKLTGLTDDDHTQYLLATGARTGASSQAQTFTNGIVGPSWQPAADSTTALQMQNASGAAIMTIDTTNQTIGINVSPVSSYLLYVSQSTSESKAALCCEIVGSGESQIAYGIYGGSFTPTNSTAAVGSLYGVYGRALQRSTTTGSADSCYAIYADYGIPDYLPSSNATITDNYGVYVSSNCATGGTITNNYGIYVAEVNGSGTITNNYAIFTAAGAIILNENGGDYDVRVEGTNDINLLFLDAGSNRAAIGTAAPDSKLHVALADAATNAASQLLTLSHNTSGTAAAGYGARVLWELGSSTTADQAAATLDVVWNEATHASRKADVILSAYDTAAREGMRIRGNGSAAAIGFLGATPSAQIAHVADAKTDYTTGNLDSEAEVIAAVNATNGKINAILATLEAFGFHATA